MAITNNRRTSTIGKQTAAAPKIDRQALENAFGDEFFASVEGVGVFDARISIGDETVKGVVFVNKAKSGLYWLGNSKMGEEGSNISLALFPRGLTEEEHNGK